MECTERISPLCLRELVNLWKQYVMALDDVTDRLERICGAFAQKEVPYALVGGQAVALWVATRDPAAVRTTKDVDVLLRREDLALALAAARSVAMDYFEVMGVGMLLDRADPNPRHAVHLVWAGERIRPEYEVAAPTIDRGEVLSPGLRVVSLSSLVEMKLQSFRDRDRVHLRDLIEVGLIEPGMLADLPPQLAERLRQLLENPLG